MEETKTAVEIKSESQLKLFLKKYKREALAKGYSQMSLYPNFTILVSNGTIKCDLPKDYIYGVALDIFLDD